MPRGPAALSLRSGVPVLPIFAIREGIWKFRLCFEPPIMPDMDGSKETTILRLTQAYAAVIERYIKRAPSQWLMFQKVAPEQGNKGTPIWATNTA